MNELKCNISLFYFCLFSSPSFSSLFFPALVVVVYFQFCLQTYMAPFAAIFVDAKDPENAMYNNFRVYGTGLLLIMGMYTHGLFKIQIQSTIVGLLTGWLVT